MTFQGTHFDEVLMALSEYETKEKERKAEAKEEYECGTVKQKKEKVQWKSKKSSKKKALRAK